MCLCSWSSLSTDTHSSGGGKGGEGGRGEGGGREGRGREGGEKEEGGREGRGKREGGRGRGRDVTGQGSRQTRDALHTISTALLTFQ